MWTGIWTQKCIYNVSMPRPHSHTTLPPKKKERERNRKLGCVYRSNPSSSTTEKEGEKEGERNNPLHHHRRLHIVSIHFFTCIIKIIKGDVVRGSKWP